MKSAAWIEVENDIKDALLHFSMAPEIYAKREAKMDYMQEYLFNMGLMHSIMSGHASFQNAMKRILKMFNEDMPVGSSWHADLINRVSTGHEGRPAVIQGNLTEMAHETRSFRNRAMRNYRTFRHDRCMPSIQACEFMVRHLPEAIQKFRQAVDPGFRKEIEDSGYDM